MKVRARLAYSIDIMAVSIKSSDGRISISVDEGSEVSNVVVNGERISVGGPHRGETARGAATAVGVALGLLVGGALALLLFR